MKGSSHEYANCVMTSSCFSACIIKPSPENKQTPQDDCRQLHFNTNLSCTLTNLWWKLTQSPPPRVCCTQSQGSCSSHTSTCWSRRWTIPQTRGRGCTHSALYPLLGSTLGGTDCRGAASPSWTSGLYLRPLLHRTNPSQRSRLFRVSRLLTNLMQHSVESQKCHGGGRKTPFLTDALCKQKTC